MNLLKADLYRIFKGKLGIISLIFLVLIGVGFSLLEKNSNPLEEIYSAWGMGIGLLPIFLTNIYMIVWGNEFTSRTVNNVLITGNKREIFFFSKFLLTFLLTLLSVIVLTSAIVLTVWINVGVFSVMEVLKIFVVQLPIYFAITAFGVLIFNVVRVPYVAVVLFISSAFIGDAFVSNIISIYFSNFDYLLDTLFFSNLSNLIGLKDISSNTLKLMISSGVIYGLIATTLAYTSFKTREFK
nr:hypothetical protein [Bacillus cereus]